MDGVVPDILQFGRAGEKALIAIDVERRDTGGAGDGVAGIGIAVEQLDLVFRPMHQRIVHLAAGEDRAHRDRAVGQPLGGGDDIWGNAKIVGGEGGAHAAETGDDLIEDQEDTVLVADGAQALQITLWRHQHAGRPGDRFDDAGGDGFRAMQGDQTFQVVRKLGAVLGLALHEAVLRRIMGVTQVVCGDLRENTTVVDEAAHGDAAETDAMITALTTDQPAAGALADGALIGNGDLQRRIDRFRSGARIEDTVQFRTFRAGRNLRQPLGEFKGNRVAHLEGGRVIHCRKLVLDGRRDLLAAVAGIDAPKASRAVENLATIIAGVIHAFGARQQAGIGLELPVGGKRHPVAVKRGGIGSVRIVHGDLLFVAGD